jgi:hypothetical protein
MWLLNHHVDFTVPAGTVGDILKREGLDLTERESAERRGIAGPRPASVKTMVWSADFKGKFRLLSREYCHPFTLTDNHSRYLLMPWNRASPSSALSDAFWSTVADVPRPIIQTLRGTGSPG